MTDEEIKDALAKHVMQWQLDHSPFGAMWVESATGEIACRCDEWKPLNDWNDAMRVRDAINCWLFSERWRFKAYLLIGISERIGLRDHATVGIEEVILMVEPRDMAIAALRAVGVEVSE